MSRFGSKFSESCFLEEPRCRNFYVLTARGASMDSFAEAGDFSYDEDEAGVSSAVAAEAVAAAFSSPSLPDAL